MNKIITLAVALLLSFAQLSAQTLFKEVHDKASAVVNSPYSSEEQIIINQFKVTVLNYMITQNDTRHLNKSIEFFDTQAVYLASFVTDYRADVMRARGISKDKRLMVEQIYRDASLENPLFHDTNRSRVRCYVDDKKSPTPFSIDTDWYAAYKQAKKYINTLLK